MHFFRDTECEILFSVETISSLTALFLLKFVLKKNSFVLGFLEWVTRNDSFSDPFSYYFLNPTDIVHFPK